MDWKNQAFLQSNRQLYKSFAFLDLKLWLKEGDYQILKHSLKFTNLMSESINFFQSLFYIQYSKTGNSYLFGINNNQTFHVSNFDSSQSLGRKGQFFRPLGFEPKSTFSHKTWKIKSQQGFKTLPEWKEFDLWSRNCINFLVYWRDFWIRL